MVGQILHWIMGGLSSVAAWFILHHDPWYSDGWFLEHSGWVLLAAVVALVAIVACMSDKGLIAVSVLALIGAIGFGVLYQRDLYLLFTWVLHLLVLALLVGVAAGSVRKIFGIWYPRPASP